MSKASTLAHREQRKAAVRKRKRRPRIHPVAVLLAIIVLLAVVATLLSRGGGTTTDERSTAPVSITGSSLPAAPRSGKDPAIGMEAPVVTGIDFAGDRVAIEPAGKPMIVVLLTHWCPHCRDDVPDVQSWIDEHGMPPGVDVYSISTWVDSAKANYPPGAWLEREGWTVPVLLDDERSSAATAYGLSATPMWVAVGADGRVIARVQAELGGEGLAKLAAAIAPAA